VQDGETPPYAHKKSHRMRRPKLDENLAERITDPDSRVPVVNNDGQILTGDDAPFLRELDMWLEEHPSFTPLSEVLLFGHCLVELSIFWNRLEEENQWGIWLVQLHLENGHQLLKLCDWFPSLTCL